MHEYLDVLFHSFLFLIRKRWLLKNGIDLNEICKMIPEETLEV